MTIREIEAMDSDFLTVEQVAQVLGSGAQFLRVQAHDDPNALGFPVCVQGSRIKVPREGFLFWAKYGRPVVTAKEV